MSGQKFEECLADYKNQFGDGIRDDMKDDVTGIPFPELLLNGFIRANPVNGADPAQRLSDAMHALFGHRGSRYRSDEKDDNRALSLLAYWYYREEKAGRRPILSKLAKRAANYAPDFNNPNNPNADPFQRLYRKFQGKTKALLLKNEEERRNHAQDLHWYALEDIEEMLAQLGIPFQAEG